MPAKPVKAKEQYRLVMECRSSGLTDHQWCREKGICPGTFYGWVRRLRQKGYQGIQEPVHSQRVSTKQEIVRIEPDIRQGRDAPPPLLYQKYANSMPLHRQEQDWKQMGIILSRATLANWILYCAGNYFSPLYDYFHRELVKRQFLMANDTRVQVLKEPGRNAETDSFMWLFRTGEDGLPPIILYRYTQTKAGFHAAGFLKGFKGYLETDCYQGYNGLPDVKRCCCWAHLRRYFVEAVPKGKELDYGNPAAQGVQYCNKLFEHERQSHEKGHSHEQRKEYRIQKEMPVLDAFWKWISQQSPKKGTRFEKAVNHAQNHREQFMTYLEDGRCSFSNNLSENSIRPFTVGRPNWLFSDTPKGADASAMVYTMVEMAKAHNLNIYKYLKYLLEHLPETKIADSELSRLAPWNPEVIGRCSGTM